LAITDVGNIMRLQKLPSPSASLSFGYVNAVSESPEIQDRCLTSSSNEFWAADREGLRKYKIDVSGDAIPGIIQGGEDQFVCPLQLIRDVVYHVRQQKERSGYIFAATKGLGGPWEVRTAESIVLLTPGSSPYLAEVVDRAGTLFRIRESVKDGAFSVECAIRPELSTSFKYGRSIEMSHGRWLLAGEDELEPILLYEPATGDTKSHVLPCVLPNASSHVANATSMVENLLIVQDGQRYELLALNGEQQAFARIRQEGARANGPVQFEKPAIMDGGLVINRRGGEVHYAPFQGISLGESKPIVLEKNITSPLVRAGSWVFAVAGEGEESEVILISPTRSTKPKKWSAPEGIDWGPIGAQDCVLIGTREGRIVCLDGRLPRSIRWTKEYSFEPPVGPPLLYDGSLLLASAEGNILLLSPKDGELRSIVDIAEECGWSEEAEGTRLVTGPVAYTDQCVIVGASDSAVYVVPLP